MNTMTVATNNGQPAKKAAAASLAGLRLWRDGDRDDSEISPTAGGLASPSQDSPANPAAPEPQRRDDLGKDSDIYSYWCRIKAGRKLPAWRDLDANQIAFHWPNSFLLACRGNGGPGQTAAIAGATRITDTDGTADGNADIAITTPMIEWIVNLSTDVAERARPLWDEQIFSSAAGVTLSCEVIAMPLGEDGGTVDHILCHLRRR